MRKVSTRISRLYNGYERYKEELLDIRAHLETTVLKDPTADLEPSDEILEDNKYTNDELEHTDDPPFVIETDQRYKHGAAAIEL